MVKENMNDEVEGEEFIDVFFFWYYEEKKKTEID